MKRTGRTTRRAAKALATVATLAFSCSASAHSASDAYLTLDTAAAGDGGTIVHAQWDIALRDLDFVIGLDDDGDGWITWRELRRHQAAIARYALASIVFRAGGRSCSASLNRQLVDEHADGAYAALFFDVRCPPSAEPLALDYRLFFRIDPSHRAIVVARSGADVATALLSPGHATIPLATPPRLTAPALTGAPPPAR